MSVSPICPFFFRCGGCHHQDIEYSEQLKTKEDWLQSLFLNTVPESSFRSIIASTSSFPVYFRNKIRFSFIKVGETIHPSRHHKTKNHDISVNNCFLMSPKSMEIINFTAHFATDHNWKLYDNQTDTGWLKHIIIRDGKKTDQIMVSLVTANPQFNDQEVWLSELSKHFPEIESTYHTVTMGRNNSTFKDILLAGKPTIYEKIGDYTFQISLHSFFQTNGELVEKLYQTILEIAQITPTTVLWDLYAGSATIGIYCSPHVKKVVCVESNPSNILDAEWNIQHNGIKNIEIIASTVENLTDDSNPSIIIVDPPRAGLTDQALNILVTQKAAQVIYVSCNPKTCLRDCTQLIKAGYKISTFQPLDLFPHSDHCELIVSLSL